ncbi:MAG: flagellar biosynthetic protein FliR [Oscillospiraceae bacterium]|nr:flagellar biosynthetic protein FliR [Oscillospiraceae bacterium]
MAQLQFTADNFYSYILVLARISAIVFFNPVISRSQVSFAVKTAAAAGISLLLMPFTGITCDIVNIPELLLCITSELAVGFVLAYVFNIYFYMLSFAGDIIDEQSGLLMGRVFDPLSGTAQSVTGKLLHILFLVYIFITNSHLVFIRLLISSYDTVSAGMSGLSLQSVSQYGIELFISVFSLAVRLAVPFIAAALIVETGMGILMRLIPEFNMFVMNMQIKIIVFMIVMLAMAKPVTVFLENYIISMFDSMQRSLCSLV